MARDRNCNLERLKLLLHESLPAAAEREVVEETGHLVSVHEFLGVISYKAASRKPKVVQFWRMQAADKPAQKLMRDIKAVKWLPLKSAIEKLDDPLEQLFLRNVGQRALSPSVAAESPPAPVAPAA